MDAAKFRPVVLDPFGNVDASLPQILRWGGPRTYLATPQTSQVIAVW
jgi:hypothetical protein